MAFSPAQVEQLLRPVNPRRVQRDNHGMSHLAAYDVSAHLTRIFGFGGWRKEILTLELVAEDGIIDKQRDRIGWYVTYRCTMRLHIVEPGGHIAWWNEDGATGSASNLPDRGDAHDFALKNAISYALKRCAKDLGDQFGLSLYNKGSTAALVGRTLAGLSPQSAGSPSVDHEVPDLAPDWDEAPPGRADGLPVNRDGSLSRSQTDDAEKERAGVMTAAQQAEHTALQPKQAEVRGKVTRIQSAGQREDGSLTDADPWQDAPAGTLDGTEDKPGTIDPADQTAIHAFYDGKMNRDQRLKHLSAVIGREVTSSNDLSYQEGRRVRDRLKGVKV